MAESEVSEEQDADGRALTGSDRLIRAAGRRKRAADRRAQAAEYRGLAAQDREAAAQDREQAARDRSRIAIDPLTEARARAAGLTAVAHELDRCRRTNGRLVVACLEVAGNDRGAPGVSDDLLKRAAALMRAHLRSYDLVIRIRSSVFLCAMSNMTLAAARERCSVIAARIADGSDGVTITAGYADAVPDDTAADLIARADSELSASRIGN